MFLNLLRYLYVPKERQKIMESLKNLTDEKLIGLLNQGSEPAYTELYHRYWSSLYSSVYNRVRDREMCQDIVQEVFLDVWRRRDELRVDDLSAYLHTSVRFLAYRRLAKQSHHAPYYETFEQTLVSSLFADNTLLEGELRQLLDRWVAALPDKRRRIFLLHFADNLSTDKIAEQLGLSRKTVQNQLTTAYAELRAKYAHYLTLVCTLTLWKGW